MYIYIIPRGLKASNTLRFAKALWWHFIVVFCWLFGCFPLCDPLCKPFYSEVSTNCCASLRLSFLMIRSERHSSMLRHFLAEYKTPMRCSSCGQRGKKIFSLIRFISFIYIIMPRLPTIFPWLLSDMIWFTIWSPLSNMVWFTSPSSCRCISKYITMHYKSPWASHKPTLTHHTYELHRWTLTLFLGEQLFFFLLSSPT